MDVIFLTSRKKITDSAHWDWEITVIRMDGVRKSAMISGGEPIIDSTVEKLKKEIMETPLLPYITTIDGKKWSTEDGREIV